MPATRVDVRRLAYRQKQLLIVFLAMLFFYIVRTTIFVMFPMGLRTGALLYFYLSLPLLALQLWALVQVILLMASLGKNVMVIILTALLMLVPVLNLLLLLVINQQANKTLQRAGVKVGLFGAVKESLEMALDPTLCKACGYNMTGNVSGYCPECGRPFVPKAPSVSVS